MNELSVFSHEELLSLAEYEVANQQMHAALCKCKYLSDQAAYSSRLSVCFGKIYLEINLPELAESHFLSALKLDSSLLDVKFELAILERNKGDFNAALRLFTEIINVEPNNAEVLFYLGDLSFHLKHYAEAEQHFERLIDAAPNNSSYVYQASEYLQELNGLALSVNETAR